MNRNKENDILETTLSIAENEYSEAYRFLLNAYEESPSSFGPQTFYFAVQRRLQHGIVIFRCV